jgi:hypothetical protein
MLPLALQSFGMQRLQNPAAPAAHPSLPPTPTKLPAGCSLAEPGGTIALLSTLRGLLGEIGDAPWAYAWLPAPAVAALASLLHASLLRSLGRGAAAATHLAAAAEAVEQQLAAVGIDLQVGAGAVCWG